MNFTNKNNVKLKIFSLIISAICLILAISIGVRFSKPTPIASASVTTSNDIEMLVNDFNSSLKNSNATAKYVQNYTTAKGDKVSGILVTVNAPSRGTGVSSGFYSSGEIRLGANFNIKNMTGDTNAFAGVIFSLDEYPDEVTEESIILSNVSVGMREVNSWKGFAFTFENGLDNNDEYYDTPSRPEVSLGQKVYYENSLDSYVNAGVYQPSAINSNYGVKGRAPASLNGYTATPFNMYYDYKTNVTYKDIAELPKHQSNYTRLGQLLSVNPKNRTEISNFSYEFFGFSAKLANYNLTPNYHEFNGFKNGLANFSFSYVVRAGEKATILFTSVMGLDLTIPTAEFSTPILVDETITAKALGAYEIKTPSYQTANGKPFAKTFDGVVNVYNGERSFPYSYDAYGASKNSVSNDLGEAIYSNKQVGDKISLNPGVYTFNYLSSNGESAFVTATIENAGVGAEIETDSSFIKTKGVTGVSVKFKIPLDAYNDLISTHGENSVSVTGVIALAPFIDSLNANFNENISYQYAKLANSYPTKIKTTSVTNWTQETGGDGVTYKTFYLTLSNVKEENYNQSFYFGAYIQAGEEIICFTDSQTEFVKISVLSASQLAFSNLSTENGNYSYSAEIYGVNYYSNVYTQKEMEKVVKFYLIGLYLKANVTTTFTESYASHEYNGVVYYYNSSVLDSPTQLENVLNAVLYN